MNLSIALWLTPLAGLIPFADHLGCRVVSLAEAAKTQRSAFVGQQRAFYG